MGRVVLDTSILIAIEKGQIHGGSIFESKNKFFLPEMAVAEFLVGIELSTNQQRRDKRLRFLKDFEKLTSPVIFDRAHALAFANLAAQARKSGKPRGQVDLAIAASAFTLEAVLYTRDSKGKFDQLIGLTVKEF